METVIRMKVNKTTKMPHWAKADENGNGKFCHGVEMTTVYTNDKDDPNYIYGSLSSGSRFDLQTINPNAVSEFEPGDVLEITIKKVPTAE